MKSLKKFLKIIWPFLITLVLWRLSARFWNPVGILSLIPIFFYSFVRPINWFPVFGLLICFLIDYKSALPLFWTIIYCLFYAINGFQNYVDIQNMGKNALYIFSIFTGFGFLILTFFVLTWSEFINNCWLFIWLNTLYTPIIGLDKWIKK